MGVLGFVPCMCVPFCMSDCYDFRHRCSRCKKTLMFVSSGDDDSVIVVNGGSNVIIVD